MINKPLRWSLWKKKLTSVRSRIFIFYVVLMSVFLGISIPLSVKFVLNQVDDRVTANLALEATLFDGLLHNDPVIKAKLRVGNKNIVYPDSLENLIYLFNLFHSHRTPEDDTYIISTLNEDFYRAVPEALPPELDSKTTFLHSLRTSLVAKSGLAVISNSTEVIYNVKPVYKDQQILGRLIVIHIVAGERQEAITVLQVVTGVIVSVFIVSIFVTWLVAGQVLAPLPAMLKTALDIDEKNLTRRIQIQAEGELADLAEAFNKMMDRLEVAFNSQQSFITDAGHELRTPITIIRGHLELLALDPTTEMDTETIYLTIDELDRMSRLVNDLILLARAEHPDFLVRETIELSSFVPILFSKVQALADRQWHLDGHAMGTIYADGQRLTQALINLAQNAVQHTQPDDHITLGVSVDHQFFSLWVSDTGEGIPAAEQQRIFQRFARVRNSQRRSDGSGLGLAIVKRIVESHHGKISLDSKIGRGSTFCLTFPLKYQ
jgi:two-component system, OmpR family, sensor kinase